jgi:ribonuclease J
MTDRRVDIIPLGGLGEIGLNMMALESGRTVVVIDAGLMFPEASMYGVDVVIPDFSYLRTRAEDVTAVILTHGHEDHIGALPFFLREFNVPVYGTRLTLALVKEKLKEHQLLSQTILHEVAPRQKVILEPFTIEFVGVTHSIPDGVALGIETPAGLIVHSGDFKIEQSPVGADKFDMLKFAEYGERGVLALLSDSTNVEKPGYTMSEQRIGAAFRDIFQECQGRVIVACFASSLVRIQQVINVAAEFGRRVAFDGKSMVNNVRLARDLGYLDIPEDMEVSVGSLNSYPDRQVTVVTTGSQGEPMSVLTRMAMNDHRKLKVKKKDTIILSSRFIPGNERAITANINNLYRLGANVIYETVSEVHVSGHAYREELKLMINLNRPEYFIPIHGEYRHLFKHAELAGRVGVAPEKCLLAEDGDRIRFDGEGGRIVDQVETGRVLVDGKGVGDVGEVVLRDRRHLAEHGMVIPLVVIDEATGEIMAGPDMISKGFTFDEDASYLLEDAKCLVLEVFDRLAEARMEAGALVVDVAEIRVEVRRELKKFFYQILERRPVIIPQIIAL